VCVVRGLGEDESAPTREVRAPPAARIRAGATTDADAGVEDSGGDVSSAIGADTGGGQPALPVRS